MAEIDELEREREKRFIGALEILIKTSEFKVYQGILDGQIKVRQDQLVQPLTNETIGLHNQLVGEIQGLKLAKDLAHATVKIHAEKKEIEEEIKKAEEEEYGRRTTKTPE